MNIVFYEKEINFYENTYFISFFIDKNDEYQTEIFKNNKMIFCGNDFEKIKNKLISEINIKNKEKLKKLPIINKIIDNLIKNEFYHTNEFLKLNLLGEDKIKLIVDKFEYISKTDIYEKLLDKRILLNLKNYGIDLKLLKNITEENIYDLGLNSIRGDGDPIIIEEMDDMIEEVILIQKTKKIIQKSFSEKYRFLVNNKTFELMKQIVLLNVSSRELNKTLLNKIAKYSSTKNLNNDLNEYINKKIGWNLDNIIKDAKEKKCKIVYNKNNKIILKINTYENSVFFGSKQWCISYSKIMFNNYKKSGNSDIFFIFDFNKDFKDKKSMIGLTINKRNIISNCHWKDDSKLQEEDIKDVISKDIENNLKYKRCDFLEYYNEIKEDEDTNEILDNFLLFEDDFDILLLKKISDEDKKISLTMLREINKKYIEMSEYNKKIIEGVLLKTIKKRDYYITGGEMLRIVLKSNNKELFDSYMSNIKKDSYFNIAKIVFNEKFSNHYDYFINIVSKDEKKDLLKNKNLTFKF